MPEEWSSSKQDIAAGAGSQNYQAARDVNVYNHSSPLAPRSSLQVPTNAQIAQFDPKTSWLLVEISHVVRSYRAAITVVVFLFILAPMLYLYPPQESTYENSERPDKPFQLQLVKSVASLREVYSIEFSYDGSRIAAAGPGGIFVMDSKTGKALAKLEGFDGRSVAFSPDGLLLAAGGSQGIALLDTGTFVKSSVERPNVHSVAFSPDGKSIAAAGSQGAALFDTTTLQIRRVFEHSEIRSVVFSPDGFLLVAGGADGITLFDTRNSGTKRLEVGADILSVAASPDGSRFAGAGHTGFYVFDKTGMLHKHVTGDYIAVAFSRDASLLAVSGFGIELFDTKSWQVQSHLIQTVEPSRPGGVVYSIAFSPDGSQIISGGNGAISVWGRFPGQYGFDGKVGAAVLVKEGGPAPTEYQYVAFVEAVSGRVISVQHDGQPTPLNALDVIPDQTQLDLSINSKVSICHLSSRKLLTLNGPLRASISRDAVIAENSMAVGTEGPCVAPSVASQPPLTWEGGSYTDSN